MDPRDQISRDHLSVARGIHAVYRTDTVLQRTQGRILVQVRSGISGHDCHLFEFIAIEGTLDDESILVLSDIGPGELDVIRLDRSG